MSYSKSDSSQSGDHDDPEYKSMFKRKRDKPENIHKEPKIDSSDELQFFDGDEDEEKEKNKSHLEDDDKELSEFSGFSLSSYNKIKLRNGCCKECMKAFSKTGKSCLCQVPRLQRRSTLPPIGCKYCGCKGCNPIDMRRNKRQEIKRKLKEEGKFYVKRHRLIDSDEEDLSLFTDMDKWLKTAREFSGFMSNVMNTASPILGFGIPIRTPGYILGANHKWIKR